MNIKTTPKDFFLHLLSAGLLYYNAAWFIVLLHQYINHFFPRVDGYQSASTGPMRFALASLIVGFPVYIFVTRYLNKDTDANPKKRTLPVRRWSMYFTLFLASVTVIIDIIATLFNFLEGDFALRFALKSGSILLVALLVFSYYMYELRRDKGEKAPARSIFRYTAITLVTIAVLGAFFVTGSPQKARELRYDEERVRDLQSLQWQILDYWQNKEMLPESLNVLADDISGFRAPVDPETGDPYEYRILGEEQFELCATFTHASEDRFGGRSMASYPYPIHDVNESWSHEAGEACFERTIDPERYKLKG